MELRKDYADLTANTSSRLESSNFSDLIVACEVTVETDHKSISCDWQEPNDFHTER